MKSKSRSTKSEKHISCSQKKLKKQEEKNRKNMQNIAKVTKTTEKILPFKRIVKNVFEYKNGTYLDILQIKTKDLTIVSETEIMTDISQIQKFCKMYNGDIKFVGINFPTNTKGQQSYYRHKITVEQNPIYSEILSEKLEELENVERKSTDREYYLFIFADSYDDLINNRGIALSTLGSPNSLIREIDLYQKLQCLHKMTNKNTIMYNDENLPKRILREDTQDKINKLGYDPYLLESLQPRGGISFDFSDCVQTGDGYEVCLYIYDYPGSVDRHWLTYIMNISGAVTTIDLQTVNKDVVKRNLNRSVSEQKSRYTTAKNVEESMDAERRYNELLTLYENIANMGEVVKNMVARVYLSAQTREALEEIKYNIKHHLDGNEYQCCVNLNEQEYEWCSMFLPKKLQDNLFFLNKREGQPLTSENIAVGDPFHFTSLNDKYGSLYGHTSSSHISGNILLDVFHVSSLRTSYNAIIMGFMGMGKSTLLKKAIRDRVARGDFVRVMDVVGDFRYMCKELGGYIITLDGSSGIINPLHIYATMDTEEQSFAMHMNKLKNIFVFMSPESSQTEQMYFEKLVMGLYVQCKIIPENRVVKNIQVTELPNDVYPILSDLLAYAKIEYDKEVETDTRIMCSHIILVLEKMITTYGKIFNGHTSITDLINAQFVVYDIASLAHLDSSVYDAQLFSALSLCWANAVKVGGKSKQMYEDGLIGLDEITHFMLVIDESHKTINTSKPYAVDQVLVYAREGRKYFSGIWLASQSVNDFMPDGTNIAGVEQIKTLFGLSQYKFIFKQDAAFMDKLIKVFGNNLTETEISQIPILEKGECVMSTGAENLIFKVSCTDEELAMFKGGV